jgi:hypothetical protein
MSCVPPEAYALRFEKFMCQCFSLEQDEES